MVKYLIPCFSIFFLLSCSRGKSRPLSDNELADLAKNFDLNSEELKKFRPGPIEEKFEVKNQHPQIILTSERKKILIEDQVKPKDKISSTKGKKKKDTSADKAEKVNEKKHANSQVEETPAEQGPEDIYKLQDAKSAKYWNSIAPKIGVGEIHVIKIKYLGITVGNITLKTMPNAQIGGVDTYHFRGLLQSSTYYDMLYKLDDVIESFVSSESFLPIKYFVVQRESGKNVDDLQLFDHEKRKTYTWYKKEKKGEVSKSEKQGNLPIYFQDGFSALHFIRGLPLVKGSEYELPVITKAKMYIAKVVVVGNEKVRVLGQNFEAIHIRASNHIPGVEDKKEDVELWFSTDASRTLLKLKTKIKLGTVEGELIEYHKR